MPLFIKAPGQKRAKIDDAWVETIDILPTIFDILNLDPRVKMDGKSAFSDEVQNRDELRFLIRNTFEVLKIPADDFERERRADHRPQPPAVRLGRGRARAHLRDRPAPRADRAARLGGRAEQLDVDLAYARLRATWSRRRATCPSTSWASVNGPDRHPRDIAVAVNGTIRAVGNTFKLAVGDAGELVSVMVPESAFHKGRNDVQVLRSALEVREADLDVVQDVVLRLLVTSGSTNRRAVPICSAPSPAAAELVRDRLVGRQVELRSAGRRRARARRRSRPSACAGMSFASRQASAAAGQVGLVDGAARRRSSRSRRGGEQQRAAVRGSGRFTGGAG